MNYRGEVFSFFHRSSLLCPSFNRTSFFVYNSLFVIFFRWRSASAVKRAMEDKVRCIISTNKTLENEKIYLLTEKRWRKHCYLIHVPRKQPLRIIFPWTECFSPRLRGLDFQALFGKWARASQSMVIICIVRGQTESATRNFRLEAYIHNHPVTVYVDRPLGS